ncbi:hypothetical protein M0R45_009652 [Rubus argutus]|uniref:Pentatricopeptide repeat-containing protein n=1 Tax=Rubus argutus TaxID=59490 RepID=A0AAW1Y846_RUBAR
MRLRLPFKSLHSFSQKHSLSTNASESVLPYGAPEPLYTQLFRICREQCRLIKSHKVFGDMPERELAQASRTCKAFNCLENKDVFAWNSLLSMYSNKGLLERVVKSFELMWNCKVFAE